MRVRFYETGKKSRSAVYIEQFPARIALTDDGRICPQTGNQREVCVLEEVQGQLVFHCGNDVSDLQVNGEPLESGPLSPGDRLQVRDKSFLVSYESAAPLLKMPSRYRMRRDLHS